MSITTEIEENTFHNDLYTKDEPLQAQTENW